MLCLSPRVGSAWAVPRPRNPAVPRRVARRGLGSSGFVPRRATPLASTLSRSSAAVDLDFRATVPGWQVAGCLAAAAVGTGAVTWAWLGLSWATVASRPGPLILGLFGPRERFILVALGALVFAALVSALAEVQEQARLVPPRAIAAPDSRFARLGQHGLEVHYKSIELKTMKSFPPGHSPPAAAIAFMHGFGASLFDWTRDLSGDPAGCVLIRTATALDDAGTSALLMAYDSPGFGLTERTSDLRDYSVERNGALASELLDFGLSDVGMAGTKRVLVGHSLGGLAAAQALYESRVGDAEEGDADTAAAATAEIDGLVLVSPAILPGAFHDGRRNVPRLVQVLGAIIAGILQSLASLTLAALAPLGLLLLRALVRNKKFWQRGLASAFASPASVTPALVDGYRGAKVVKGWDVGMWRFVRSRVTPLGPLGTIMAALQRLDRPRLMDVLLDRRRGVPILLVHGTDDAIIPVSNSRAIAEIAHAAGATLEYVEVPGTGHNLYLEQPEEFSRLLASWVQRCVVNV